MADDAMKTANAAKALSEQNDAWINRNGKTLQGFMDETAKRIKYHDDMCDWIDRNAKTIQEFMNEVKKQLKAQEDTNKAQAKTIAALQKDIAALKKGKK